MPRSANRRPSSCVFRCTLVSTNPRSRSATSSGGNGKIEIGASSTTGLPRSRIRLTLHLLRAVRAAGLDLARQRDRPTVVDEDRGDVAAAEDVRRVVVEGQQTVLGLDEVDRGELRVEPCVVRMARDGLLLAEDRNRRA